MAMAIDKTSLKADRRSEATREIFPTRTRADRFPRNIRGSKTTVRNAMNVAQVQTIHFREARGFQRSTAVGNTWSMIGAAIT